MSAFEKMLKQVSCDSCEAFWNVVAGEPLAGAQLEDLAINALNDTIDAINDGLTTAGVGGLSDRQVNIVQTAFEQRLVKLLDASEASPMGRAQQ